MTSRKAFEAWHGGLYRGHQEEIAYAAWQAAIQHARDVAEDCIEHERLR